MEGAEEDGGGGGAKSKAIRNRSAKNRMFTLKIESITIDYSFTLMCGVYRITIAGSSHLASSCKKLLYKI